MSRKSVVDDYEWIRMERDRIRREKEAARQQKDEDASDASRDITHDGSAP